MTINYYIDYSVVKENCSYRHLFVSCIALILYRIQSKRLVIINGYKGFKTRYISTMSTMIFYHKNNFLLKISMENLV